MGINLFGQDGMFGQSSGDLEDESDADAKLDIPIHAFDVVIADECHRGYTAQEESKWREVLKHFDGIRIGLTATPAAHTTAFFKDAVFRYEYERAVKEGFLVDYDAVSMQNLNQSIIKEMTIPLPPLPEQHKVVHKARSLFDIVKVVETRYLESRKYTDKLEQSILAKAFRGELVSPKCKNEAI